MYMELVYCDRKYWEFIRTLRNDKRVVSGFIQSTYITKDLQQNYKEKYSNCFRVALLYNEPVGYVGVIEDDIRVCTHPNHQGRGVGKFMINKCMEIWPTAFAKVKVDNQASLKLFESCGFTKSFYILNKS